MKQKPAYRGRIKTLGGGMMRVTIHNGDKTYTFNKYIAILYLLFHNKQAINWILDNWEANEITIQMRNRK